MQPKSGVQQKKKTVGFTVRCIILCAVYDVRVCFDAFFFHLILVWLQPLEFTILSGLAV